MKLGIVKKILKNGNGYEVTVKGTDKEYIASEKELAYDTKTGDWVKGKIKDGIFIITNIVNFEYINGKGSSNKNFEKDKISFKCGHCPLWSNREQGEKKADVKREYKIFGKSLGFCNCSFGGNYPMFNYEKCPKLNN